MLTKEDVAFRHYRKFDKYGNVDPRAGVTVAFPKNSLSDFGFAYCSLSDNFEYAQGRELALNRLNAHLEQEGPSVVVDGESPAYILGLLDFQMAMKFGYAHITRSKNRRSKRHEA